MKTALSLAAGVLPEFEPEVVAYAAAEARYPFAGFTIDPSSWSPARTRALAEQVKAAGIGVLDVEPVWIPAGAVLNDDHRMIIDVGAELGARNLLVVSREADPSRNAEALHQICERAEPAGMRAVLEFLMVSKVRSLSAALSIVEACAHPAAGILIDTLHLQRAGEGVSGIRELDPHLLPYAQFCDGDLNCDDNFAAYRTDAMDGRSAPGEGNLPLSDVLDALPVACPLSLEIRSKRYRESHPEPVDRARVLLDRTQRFLEER